MGRFFALGGYYIYRVEAMLLIVSCWRHRDGACGGPLKRGVLSIHGDDLSGKVL